jgi:hypothetical protein
MHEALAARLRGGFVLDDAEFDTLYPDWARGLSRYHWTPVAVARHAAHWLVDRPGRRVLDVGSGVGKFAIIGALVTEGDFYGVEQRKYFLDTAQSVAGRLGASRATFLHGNMMAVDWKMFDAFYLYNPFVENLGLLQPIDETTDLRPEFYSTYVEFVRHQLVSAAIGSRVVTYHGFGGNMPSGYQRRARKRYRSDFLELWVKGGEPKT